MKSLTALICILLASCVNLPSKQTELTATEMASFDRRTHELLERLAADKTSDLGRTINETRININQSEKSYSRKDSNVVVLYKNKKGFVEVLFRDSKKGRKTISHHMLIAGTGSTPKYFEESVVERTRY